MVFLHPSWRPRRSVLFVPAANTRAMAKAATLYCDAIIFDLEDSVGHAQRDDARGDLAEKLAETDYGGREIAIRVSALDTREFAADLQAALACNPAAIVLPKIEGPMELGRARSAIAGAVPDLWAMIETPRAVTEIAAIAGAAPAAGLTTLIIGPNDLARTTGVPMRPGRAAMVPWFMNVIAAARANGLTVLDGVCNNFSDGEGFAAECAQGADLGFDGKTLIHPAQIAAANDAFSPRREEMARARAIVAAYEKPGRGNAGAIQIDGEMVEPLHLEMARALLAAFPGETQTLEKKP